MDDKRYAVLIDSDNISSKYISDILDEMTKYGVITYKRIYGDWTSTQASKWKKELMENSITPIQQFCNTVGKNATDSTLIIDAMDILYTNNVDGFCIVSSDGDFTRLASRLRESGMDVIGMGESKTPRSFRAANISRDEQKKRFKRLEESKETAWRVTEADWKRNKDYDTFLEMNEEMLQRTDTGYAPWTIVEATDKNYAAVKILSTVTDRLEYELNRRRMEREEGAVHPPVKLPDERFKNGVLSGVDLTKTLTREEYKERLDKLQKKLEVLHGELYRLRIPVVIGFEGWDAAGKGGAIRRLTSHLDPRGYKVNPTAAPNDVEKVHHYLWRFWREMPKAGHIAIFDRTWYGRVMVERIEGFCSEADWKRAYQEINEMEEHMANFGAVIVKFWIHIDKDEQERRFKERMEAPAKQWKITDEDWRNREKWDAYEQAVNEMLVRTSTTYAPWTIVEGNSKYYARVKVLETVVEAMEEKIREVKKLRK